MDSELRANSSPTSRHDFGDVQKSFITSYLSLDKCVDAAWKGWTTENPHQSLPLVQRLFGIEESSPTVSSAKTEPAASKRSRGSTATLPDTSTTTNLSGPRSIPRILRQDLHDTIFSFICSQNNHLKRITSMIDWLCASYGELLVELEEVVDAASGALELQWAEAGGGKRVSSAAHNPHRHCLFSIPSATTIASRVSEDTLRGAGFGYRSKYIVASAKHIVAFHETNTASVTTATTNDAAINCSKGSLSKKTILPKKRRREEDALAPSAPHPISSSSLFLFSREEPFYRALQGSAQRQETQRELLVQLQGVGRKVADCVLLFALDGRNVVPIDTHMAQIAVESILRSKRSMAALEAAAAKATSPMLECNLKHLSVLKALIDPKKKVIAKDASAKQRGANGKSDQQTNGSLVASASGGVPAALLSKHHDALQWAYRELLGPDAGWAHTVMFVDKSGALKGR
jgi:N-glycosylase/DNA lyase